MGNLIFYLYAKSVKYSTCDSNEKGYTCSVKSGTNEKQSTSYYCDGSTMYFTSCPTSNCVDGDDGGCRMIVRDENKPNIILDDDNCKVSALSGINYIAYNTFDGEKLLGWKFLYCDGVNRCDIELENVGEFTLIQSRALNGNWAKNLEKSILKDVN